MSDLTSKEKPSNWVTAEMTAEQAAAVAKEVSSEEWTYFDTHFFQSCCDCGLSHRVNVRRSGEGFEVQCVRLDEYTDAIRKTPRFTKQPQEAGEIERCARVLVTNPHQFDVEDGNYKVEGAPFEALKAAINGKTPNEPGGWRPIKTAPKKGRFMVWIPATDLAWPAYAGGDLIYSNAHGALNEMQDGRVLTATHWMPLPSAPSTKADRP